MSALALIVAATLAQAGTLRSDLALRGGGAGRSVVALSAWDKGGSESWGAGIPSPTIDCAPLPGSTGGDIVCSGASPTEVGSPTTGTSPIWYRGDSAVRPSVTESGANYHNLGDVADASTAMTSCVIFNARSVAGATFIAAKSAANSGYLIYASTTSLVLRVCNGTGCTSGGTVAISAGSWYVACHAYSHALGTIIGNANGVAGLPETSVAGPIADTSADLTIGAPGGAAVSIRRVAIWTGWAADAAQLAQLVATQWGLAADRPAGTVATHSRTDSTLCCPFSDAECFWLGPGAPCIHAPTYSGWASGGAVAGGIEVYGPGANSIPTSTNVCGGEWLHQNSMACAASGTDAAGSAESFRLTAGATNSRSAGVVGASGTLTHTFSLWVKAGTQGASGSIGLQADGGTAAGCANFTPGASWARVKTTHTQAYSSTLYPRIYAHANCEAGSATVGDNILVSKPQITVTAYPVPYRATTGTGYAGLASTATTVTVPVPAQVTPRGALLVSATPTGDWTVADRYLVGATGGHALRAYTNGALYLYLDNNSTPISSWATGWTGALPHQTGLEWTGAAASIWSDGVLRASGASAFAPPAAWTIGYGQQPGGGSAYLNGLVSRVAQCRRAGGCR